MGLGTDLRHALRGLAAERAWTAVAVTTLALGIGANAAIFAVVDAALLRPLPFADPERLVAVWGLEAGSGPQRQRTSYPDFRDYQEGARRSFEGFAVYRPTTLTLTARDLDPIRVDAAVASHELFPLLRATPLLGRDRHRRGGPRGRTAGGAALREPVARALGGPPRPVGRHDHAGRRAAHGGGRDAGLVPLPSARPVVDCGGTPGPQRVPGHPLVSRGGAAAPGRARARRDGGAGAGRERAGLRLSRRQRGPDRARGAAAAVARGRGAARAPHPPGRRGPRAAHHLRELRGPSRGARQPPHARAGGAGHAGGDPRPSRQAASHRDGRGVRARRARGAPGGCVAGAYPRIPGPARPARLQEVVFDRRVALVCLAVTVLTACLSAAPAVVATRVQPAEVLRSESGRASAGPARQRLRQALTLAQTTLAVVLLIGAGLLVRSLYALGRVEPGFVTPEWWPRRCYLPESRYPDLAGLGADIHGDPRPGGRAARRRVGRPGLRRSVRRRLRRQVRDRGAAALREGPRAGARHAARLGRLPVPTGCASCAAAT